MGIEAAAQRWLDRWREPHPGPHLHGLGGCMRVQEAVDFGEGPGLPGVLLERLLQGPHGDAMGGGGQLHPRIGPAGPGNSPSVSSCVSVMVVGVRSMPFIPAASRARVPVPAGGRTAWCG